MNNKPANHRDFLQRLRQREGLFRILVFTFLTALLWIGFSIFLSQKKTIVPENVQQYTIPLNPNIDRRVIFEISQRKSYSEQELSAFPINLPEGIQSPAQSDFSTATNSASGSLATNSAQFTDDITEVSTSSAEN